QYGKALVGTNCMAFPPQFPSLHRKGGKAGTRPGLAHRMVKDLAARYHHSNMTMDNFYTSVPLLNARLSHAQPQV
ncbi:hypothetical protein RRG08_061912, partial [Elysia crispata]